VVQREGNLAEIFQRAVSLHENGELADAERLYQNLLKLDHNHSGCLHHLGLLRAQQGRLGDALGLLELALARSPDSAEILNHAGSVLHAMKRHRPRQCGGALQ
jgi:protein O-GlcNAc transferase